MRAITILKGQNWLQITNLVLLHNFWNLWPTWSGVPSAYWLLGYSPLSNIFSHLHHDLPLLDWLAHKLLTSIQHSALVTLSLHIFLAATKQLYKWYFPSVCPSVRLSVCPSVCLSVCPSVRLSVRLSHLFDYVPLIESSWNFQELLLMTKVRSMQKVKVRGQRSRSQRSQPNLTVSGL